VLILSFSVLVGNKCDLRHRREVKQEEGAAVARAWGVPFFETSAKTKVNHEECFYELVREVRKEQEKLKLKKKQKGKCLIL